MDASQCYKRNYDVRLLSDYKYFCFVSGELPRSCKDVKNLKGVTEDGEYFLQVKGKTLKVHFSNRLIVNAFPEGARGPCLCSSLPLLDFLPSVFSAIPLHMIRDKILTSLSQVYCSGMQTDSPKEYVTLVNGDAENFSEVYGYR